MIDPETPLRALHDKFCTLTGRTDRYEPYRYEWAAWHRIYTEKDLVDTLAYVLLVNKTRKRGMEIQTSVLKLICDVREFERHRADMDLQQRAAAAKKRQWQASAGQVALAEMRREEITPPDEPAKRISTALVADSILKGHRQ